MYIYTYAKPGTTLYNARRSNSKVGGSLLGRRTKTDIVGLRFRHSTAVRTHRVSFHACEPAGLMVPRSAGAHTYIPFSA